MYCSECGKQVPDEAKFCPSCGTQAFDARQPLGNPTTASVGVVPLSFSVPGELMVPPTTIPPPHVPKNTQLETGNTPT